MPEPTPTAASATDLRLKARPVFSGDGGQISMVDLFAGCGGLSLGVAQATAAAGVSLDIRLAVDFEQTAVDVYKANFPDANVVHASVETYFDGDPGDDLTVRELAVKGEVGPVAILVGGPPCQGHSNLNNFTRRDDPKNKLYLRMARAAEVLLPDVILIENVPSVRLDTAGVVKLTVEHLESLHYKVSTATLRLDALGVAQKRRRHVILATRLDDVEPELLLGELVSRQPDPAHDLRWAIGDLEDVPDATGYDVASKATPVNLARMQYLDDNELLDLPNPQRPKCHQNESHTYKSMYGRLSWDKPAQTLTSGFGSIGQGRYMHPSRLRTITPHEAARIQGFPDYFDFSAVTKRSALATMIGNAVPPVLMFEVAGAFLPTLPSASEADAVESDAVPSDGVDTLPAPTELLAAV